MNVNLPVIVRILIEEQTFTPFHLRGNCIDISLSGALVEVEELTRQGYAALIKRQRYIRLICEIPGRDKPLTLFGRIVWYDYQGETGNGVCKIGIAFEPMKEETRDILTKFLNSTEARHSETVPKPL